MFMNHQVSKNKELKELLDDFLQTHYNGSFPQMVCEYIRVTGMSEEDVGKLLDAIKNGGKRVNVGAYAKA